MSPATRLHCIALIGLLTAASVVVEAQPTRATLTTIAELKGVRVGDAVPSPNGRLIAYTADGEIRVLDIAKRTSTSVVRGPALDILSWSPAGDAIAFIRERDADYSGYIWSIRVDPATGAATESAQRVSMSKPQDSGVYSFDGKTIAFVTFGERPALRTVPANGGRERLVASLPYRWAGVSGWSAEGSKIYLMASVPDPASRSNFSLVEVNVSDGARKDLTPLRGCMLGSRQRGYFVDFDCTPNGRSTDFRAIERSGRIAGNFSVANGPRPMSVFTGDAALLLQRIDAPVTLNVLSIADGATREIGPLSLDDQLPAWSPDSRRIALRTLRNGERGIAVMNADGGDRRDFPLTGLVFGNPGPIRWSPDARMIATVADSATALVVMDVATGTTRRILSLSSPSHIGPPFRIGVFEWTRDSRAIRFLHRHPQAGLGVGRTSIHEVTLDGTDRELREVTPYLAGGRWFRFVTDSTFVVIGRDTTFVVPTSGNASVGRFPVQGSALWTPSAMAPGGDLIASASVTPGGSYRYSAIELLSTRDGTRRVLPLPFEASTALYAVPFFLPDGKNLVVVSVAAGGEPKRLWLVPTGGEQPRPIADLSDSALQMYIDLAPDGRTLVFTKPGVPTTTFIKADFSSAAKR